MSPLFQNKRRWKKHDSHALQNILDPTSNRSVPDLTRGQHLNRAAGFSSIRDLARNSRRSPLPSPPASAYEPPVNSFEKTPLRQNELERHSLPPNPPNGVGYPSLDSSIASLTPDRSGVSGNSSNLTTPSPTRNSPSSPPEEESSPLSSKGMGNKPSHLVKKVRKARSKSHLSEGNRRSEESTDSLPQHSLEGVPQLGSLPPRESSTRLDVPRRRSSLTALHANSSRFSGLDSSDPPSAEGTIRPIIPSTNESATPTDKRETLSPTLLEPPPVASRHISTASQTPSAASRSSTVPWHISFPQTFPDGPIKIPAPPLTVTHYQCYQSHRRMPFSKNKLNPVPCMACGTEDEAGRWKCTWCALRICATCMAEFNLRKRDLPALLRWLEKGKGKGPAGKIEFDDKENLREPVNERSLNVKKTGDIMRESR